MDDRSNLVSNNFSDVSDLALDTLEPTTDAETLLRILATMRPTKGAYTFEYSPAEMIEHKLQIIERLLGVAYSGICEVTDAEAHVIHSRGVWEKTFKVGMQFPVEDTLIQYVQESDDPIVIANIAHDTRATHLQDMIKLPAAAYIGVPLRTSDGSLYGILAAIDGRARTFSPAQIAMVQVLAGEIAYIIERENKLKSVLQAIEAADDDLGATLIVLDRQQTVLRIVAHDLRTPLSAIFTGSSALLQGLFGPIDPSKQRVVDLMDKASRYMNRLINDLMDASVAEDPMLALITDQFDAIAMGNELIDICQPRAQENGLVLTLEHNLDTLSMVGDRERLMQALVNLLSNAIVYTSTGSVILRINGSDERITFEVIDTGPGIAPEDLNRIWNPNVRATRTGRGLGLGLYVVALLASRMGGERGVRSTLGAGSTFWFCLPRNGGRPQLSSSTIIR